MTEAQMQREGLRTEPGIFLWILIAASAIARIVLSSRELPNGLFDDAYVTLRYARSNDDICGRSARGCGAAREFRGRQFRRDQQCD